MCWLLTVKHSPFSYQEYPERSRFQTVSKDLLISFGICPVNQFVYSDCDVLFSFSLSALSVIFSVLAFYHILLLNQLLSSQLQILLSLSDFSFTNCTTSDVDLLPFFTVWACSSCFPTFLFLVSPKRSTARLRCSSATAFSAYLLSSCKLLASVAAFSFSMISSGALSSFVFSQSIPEAASSILILLCTFVEVTSACL